MSIVNNLFVNNNAVVVGNLDVTGTATASNIVKTGGTNIQYLMADGSTLTQSATSGNSNFYLYDNTNSTTDITPVAGEVIINSTSNSTATIVYISHTTRDNIDVEVFWKFVNTLTELYLQDQSLSTNYIQYNITAPPTITVGNKLAIPVAVVNSAGTGATSFGAGHNILVSFFTNNLEVDTRISALETKTLNQTSLGSTTLFNGQTQIRQAAGVVIPHTLIIDCDGAQGPRIISSDNALVNPKPLELSCSDFNLNCSGYNNIRCAAGQNIALIGNVNNTGYTITSDALVTTGGLSTQFVKGNGTLDSSIYLTSNPDTTQRWISSAIGNDTTGTGTLSDPWATIAKGFTSGAQYPLKLNIRGSFIIPTLVLTSANSNTQITTGDGYEAQQSIVDGDIQTTGTMTRLKCSGLNFSSPNVCLLFDDTQGRHVFDNCSFNSSFVFPIFVGSTFTNWLNFNNCDFTGLTGGTLTLEPVGSACILRLYNCGVVPITISSGWTVYISGSTVLASPSAILGTVVQLPVEQFNAVITTQGAFNAISVDGLYINQVVGLTGLTGATFGCSFLRNGAVKVLSLGFNSLSSSINVLNGSTYNTWVKDPNVSGGWIALNQSLYLPLTGGSLTGQVTSNQTPILTTQLTTKKYADKTSLQSINSSYLSNFEWSARPSAAEGSSWNAVCWSTNLAVAIAANGSIMTSPNGVNWTLQANPGGFWFDVCWSQELLLFCAVANSGANKIVTSPDGITWTLQTTLSAGMSNIVWSKEASKFVSVGSGVCITSVDGINWVTQTIEAVSWSALCYSRELGIFVALASNRVGISTDGITWTGSAGINSNTWASVVWAEELGIFVAVSTNGTLRTAYSTNGTTWTYSPSSNDANSWFTVVWARECALFVAVGYIATNRVMTSTDGIKWTGRVSGNEGNIWRGLCWAKDINSFIAVSNSGTNRVMINNLQNNKTFLITTNTPFIFKGFTFKVISPEGIVFVKNNNSLVINGNQTNNYSGVTPGIYLYTYPANTVPSTTVYTTTSFASFSNPGQTNRLCFIDETNSVGYIIESITRTSGNVLITCSNF